MGAEELKDKRGGVEKRNRQDDDKEGERKKEKRHGERGERGRKGMGEGKQTEGVRNRRAIENTFVPQTKLDHPIFTHT